MPKVLICASTSTHINNFHLPYLEFFKKQGFETHVAVPGGSIIEHADIVHSIPVTKSFFSVKNIKAALMLRKTIRANRYELILTHTALAGAVCRLGAALAGKGRSGVIHTVHGYLFYRGCGLLKKLSCYIPEFLLRGVTDCLITMNEEDTETARRLVRKGGSIIRVPGMGVDPERFQPADEAEKRFSRGKFSIPESAFVLVYAAEFSKRKNHIELIRAMKTVVSEHPEALLLLCGSGALQDYIETEAQRLGLSENIRFLGWQGRMEEIYKACDLAVSSSISEGMPFNIIEAQLCALPVVASKIRGHTDLIEHGVNGRLYPPGDPEGFARMIIDAINSPDRANAQGQAARKSAMGYTLPIAFEENTRAYMSVLNGR